MASTAAQSEQAEELEDCVTYQHVKLLESAGIGQLFVQLISILLLGHFLISVFRNQNFFNMSEGKL